jgi:transcription elongation factor SPT5
MFVTRARSLASLVPKGNILKSAGADLSKMNPASAGGALVGGAVSMASIGRGPRDRVIGLVIVIVKGPKKGYVGTIKDTNGPIARVEVHTDNRVISIEKEKLRWRT